MAKTVNKEAAFAFTLPISCQICLGKVKQPVICPNQHVFCSTCMEVWLQRNKQCPACRVDITRDNPCRPVLGGLCEQGDSSYDFSSREMRKARLEMLFKDYETEIERLQRQNDHLAEESRLLQERLALASGKTQTSVREYGEVDSKRFEFISQKLEDTTRLYDQTKREGKKIKEENRKLQEENGKLTIENKNLRMELDHRSPRKFGRTAMAAMESRMEEYQKEITALKKALDRSDAYIEDLEKQLESKSKRTPHDTYNDVTFENSQSLLDGEFVDDSKLQGDFSEPVKKTGSNDDTFQLELPSPSTPGSRAVSRMKLASSSKNNNQSETLGSEGQSDLDESRMSQEETLEMPSPIQGVKKKLRFSENKPSAEITHSYPSQLASMPTNTPQAGLSLRDSGLQDYSNPGHKFSGANIGPAQAMFSSSAFANQKSLFPVPTGDTIKPPEFSIPHVLARSQSTEIMSSIPVQKSSVLDTSITPEMEDCMKLFEEAERKVEVQKGLDDFSPSSAQQAHGVASFYRSGSVDRGLNGPGSVYKPSLFPESTSAISTSVINKPSPKQYYSMELNTLPISRTETGQFSHSLTPYQSTSLGETRILGANSSDGVVNVLGGIGSVESSRLRPGDFTSSLARSSASLGHVTSIALTSSFHGATSHNSLMSTLLQPTGTMNNALSHLRQTTDLS